MSLKSVLLLALLALAFGSIEKVQGAPASEAKVVSETLGQVGEYVVTSREVRICKLIEHVLYPAAKDNGAFELGPSVKDAAFQSALTNVLLEIVVSLEAQAFNLNEASKSEVVEALQKVEASAEAKSVKVSWGLNPEELTRFIRRKIVAKNFLKYKTGSMMGVVSDLEVKSYYEANRSKFTGDSYQAYQENIRKFLSQQQLEERLRAWFGAVQRKYKVRNFLSDKPL